jgi:hypothetical protein
MLKNSHFITVIVILVFALSACTLGQKAPLNPINPNILYTAAAQTVAAQLTLSAPISIPTLLQPLPTNTSVPLPTLPSLPTLVAPTLVPTQACDKAEFIDDVTIDDDTVMSPGDNFTKTWRLKNIGTCSWTTAYSLVFLSDNAMDGPSSVSLAGNVNPGQTVDVSVDLKAPSGNGTHTGRWGLRNAAGVTFSQFYVRIKVQSGGGGGGGTFAVTHASLSASGSCGAFTITANITTNRAGTITYHWVRSDGGISSTSTLAYGSAGTQSVVYDWPLGAPGTHWVDIYIDDPNHQQFGRAHLSCP